MKKTKLILILVVILVIGVLGGRLWSYMSKPEVVQRPVVTFENMGHLVSLKMNYSDVLEYTKKRTQDIPITPYDLVLGSTRVLLIARGDCSIATDLREVKYAQINPETKQVTLSVPLPAPLTVRINHDPKDQGGSYLYNITKQGIEPLLPDSSNQKAAIDEVFSEAESNIRAACSTPDVIDQAKTNTVQVLEGMFDAVGWRGENLDVGHTKVNFGSYL